MPIIDSEMLPHTTASAPELDIVASGARIATAVGWPTSDIGLVGASASLLNPWQPYRRLGSFAFRVEQRADAAEREVSRVVVRAMIDRMKRS